ncbi:MAG: response regulator [Magnetococcales bacterium]|nr:response regulator [Magnetococcales bacterium]
MENSQIGVCRPPVFYGLAGQIWVISFALVALLITVTGLFYFYQEIESVKQNKYNELASIAELKVGQIVQWQHERLADAEGFQNSLLLSRAVEKRISNPTEPELQSALRQHFAVEQQLHLYSDIQLLDATGRLVLAASDTPDPVGATTQSAIERAFSGRKPVLSEFYLPSDGKVQLDAVAPIWDANGHPLAAIILSSHADKFLYPLIKSWPLPSRSAETLLVMRQDEEVVFLNELRHQSGTALSLRFPLTQTSLPTVQVVLGKRGLFIGMDHTGKIVLSDLRTVPDSAWLMVAKIDMDEILTEAYQEAIPIIFMVILTILFAAAVMGFAYRQRQQSLLYHALYQSEQQKRVVEEEAVRINTALQDREERLRLTQEYALDAIITIDANGLVQEINPAAESLFGYSRHLLLGQDIADYIIPPEFRVAHKNALLQHTESRGVFAGVKRKVELRGLCADGHIVNLEAGLISISIAGTLYYTAFLHDVTDRVQLLKALEESLSVAESASKAKSEFLANMSHEIRTPMNTIIGMVDLILSVPLSPQEQKNNLEIVLQSSLSLLGLINNILDFSKMDADMITLERVPFDVHGLLESVCNALAINSCQKGLELFCDLDSQLPAMVVGDPLRLRQVLVNLVSNAIKFTEEGEVLIRVEQSSIDANGCPRELFKESVRLRFSVSDTGVGIPAAKIPLVFDRFTQADGSTTRKYGGTGLGLTISKHLVALMGGELGLESVEGQGSCFHFTACFGVTPEVGSEHVDDGGMEMAVEQEVEPLAGMRILLADAHASGRTIVKGLLSTAGAEAVEEAADAVTMLTMLQGRDAARQRQQPFDLLIVDNSLLRKNVSLLDWQGAPGEGAGNVILLLPSHISLDMFAAVTWLQGARSVRKPVFRSRLLQAVRELSGREFPDEACVVEPPLASRQESGLDILLVEDNINNQKLATTILQHVGHTVTIADNGLEALVCMQKKTYDLVLMDLQMPVMDGMETTRRIRTTDPAVVVNPQVPIIAVTAKATGGEEKQSLEAGMDGYLRKPYQARDLLNLIDTVMLKRAKTVHKSPGRKKDTVLKSVGLDPVAFAERSGFFVQNFPGYLDELSYVVAEADPVQTAKWAERLSGAAREVGAWRVSIQSMRLRSSAESKNWEAAQLALTQLAIDCQQARQAILEREMGG